MTYTKTLISQIKKHIDKDSDYAVAKALGISPQHMTKYKNGTQFGDDMALKVSEMLGLNPLEVLSNLHLEQCKDEYKPLWEQLRKKAGKVENLILC